MIESVKVLVVDDSALVRHGVRSALAPHAAHSGIAFVGEAATAAAAVSECARLRPDVVLLDVRLPDRSGIEACREILAARGATRVLMLTSFADDALVYDSLLAGAHGYLLKDVDPAGLAEAITATAAGRPVLTPALNDTVLRVMRQRSTPSGEDLIARLSAQERKVLASVAEGLGNKQVAERLGLSPFTVRNYLVNVFEKLGARNRAQAVALYVRTEGARN